MPIYEYQCQDCGREFEYTQRMSEDPKTVCESCNGTLERLISRTSFHLKGGGWYKDLYASTPSKDQGSASSESSNSSDSSDSSDSTSSSSDSSSTSTSSESSTKSSAGDSSSSGTSSSGTSSSA